ncbi:MAG: glycoside hydrolase family 9 protein [Bacteroidota bacterium]
MVSGKTYTIQVGDLADNVNELRFTFEEQSLRSETVHVNQHGFEPNSRKFAYLSHWMGDFSYGPHTNGGLELDAYAGNTFDVVNVSDGTTAFTGTISKRKDKTEPESNRNEYGPNFNYSRADVWECDFSNLTTPGEYIVVVEQIGHSYPFRIEPDIYRAAYAHASHGLFLERSGIEKEVEPGWVLQRDYHPANGTQTFYYDSTVITGQLEDVSNFNFTQPVSGIWGWYHDAGDWDHYNTHLQIPAQLLHLYYMKAEHFADGDISNKYKNDPASPGWTDEGQNGLPDLLDEGGWLVHFLRRSRRALMAQNLGTGGVPGYVGRDAGFNDLPSWQDTRDVAVTGENPESTLQYAGLAAQYAAGLKRFQSLGGSVPQDSIDGWVQEAESAYNWALARSIDTASWRFAAAALFLATGNTAYQTQYQNIYQASGLPGWFNNQIPEFANLIYAVLPRDMAGLDTTFQDQVRLSLTQSLGPQQVDFAEQNRGYRHYSPAENQINMLGTFSTPRTLWAATAHHVTGEARYLNAVQAAADYFLGGNEMNMVWMTGFGENPELSTFHLDSWYSQDFGSQVYRNPIIPGLIPYGIFRNCDWMAGCSYQWVGDEDFSRSTAYPTIDDWPQSEARFQNRHSIAGSEFTVHQTSVHAVFTMGYLCTAGGQQGLQNRPTVSLNLTDGQLVDMAQPLNLSVQASAETRKVAYFYDWHFIGESTDVQNNFQFEWNTLETNLLEENKSASLITAVAYDASGLISWPSEDGDKEIQLLCDNCQTSNKDLIDSGFTVSPNPLSDDILRVSFRQAPQKPVTLTLFAPTGVQIWQDAWSSPTQSKEVQIPTLPAGYYLMQVISGTSIWQQKLVIK